MSSLRTVRFASMRLTEKLDFWPVARGAPIASREGGQRTQILPDFLIGAHAQLQPTRLISRDRGFYERLFPELILIDPTR